MGVIKISRAADTRHVFENGLSRQPILVNEYAQCAFERCMMKAGTRWDPELFKFEEKCQIFLFIKGTGYIGTRTEAHNITETAVYVPDFDKVPFFIQAGSDLEFIHILPVMSKWDQESMSSSHIVLPRFRLLSEGWTYSEPFKGPGVKSAIMLEHRELGRFSMGATLGVGPTFSGEHVHNELEQWYIALPGSSFTYTAGDEKLKVLGGDVTYTTHGFRHGSTVDEDEKLDYIWFELCENGYPGNIS